MFGDLDHHKRTNRELEKWILSYLGIEAARNPHTNSLGSISHIQISGLAPDSILRSSDDILNTMYNMQEKRLLREVKPSYWEFPQFQITADGIIKFRKQLRPIARLAINHEEQYQIVLDATEGDPKVKAELKKVPEKIKDRIEKNPKVKAELKKIPKEFKDRLKDKATDKGIEVLLDTALKYGAVAALYISKLISG